jgi:hypothetical protein
VNSGDILGALRRRYKDGRNWLYAEEVRLGTGFDYKGWAWERGPDGRMRKVKQTTKEQRIDAFAMSCYAADIYIKIAFEVKVSRGDFLREIAEPVKRAGAMQLSNQFYFITPPKLVKVHEIPDDCGLMEAHNALIRVVKRAPRRECAPPDWSFIASFMRNMAQAAGYQYVQSLIDTERPHLLALRDEEHDAVWKMRNERVYPRRMG